MDISVIATWYLLGLAQSVLVLVGVALGGILVYRTKRDAFEPLFRTDGKKDGYLTPGASQASGEYAEEEDLAWGRDVSQAEGQAKEKEQEDPTEAVLKQTRRFLQQEKGGQ